jgi:hypothetical protein
VDNCYNTGNPVAAGICKQLHYGRVHPYPAGYCHYRRVGQGHPGPEGPIAGGKLLTDMDWSHLDSV